MIRDPFGNPPLSLWVIGFITLAASTFGDRSSIGTNTFPRQGFLRNSSDAQGRLGALAGTKASASRRT
jgi:hypothetical protein